MVITQLKKAVSDRNNINNNRIDAILTIVICSNDNCNHFTLP